MHLRSLFSTLCSLALISCATAPQPQTTAQAPAHPPPPATPAHVDRLFFNQRAAEENAGVFWMADSNGDGVPQPAELVPLWGVNGGAAGSDRDLIPRISQPAAPIAPTLEPRERHRRELIRKELDQGRPTLVRSDFSSSSPEDKAVVEQLLSAASKIERLYARQKGVFGLDALIPADDPSSRAVFHRNQGPFCVAPATENEADCNALPSFPKRISGLYPEDLQSDPKFCEALSKEKNASALMDHFTTVKRKPGGEFESVPFSTAFSEDAEAVAQSLDAAAAALPAGKEDAFRAYLKAAGKAFRTNDWESANEAWAAMNAKNSAWYLRAAPDEVYYEPCGWKAGFALTLARINPDSVTWQRKLEPVKNEMEKALAALAGPPYKARQVRFQLPDFIDIVVNAGDSRSPSGATVGQSLPNWGKVAARGGRTVAMTNLFTDPDSLALQKEQRASALCPETMARTSDDPAPGIMSVVLHEAAHNLGPAHDYKVGGKTAPQIFGGPLAATMEELKAQTAALLFADWLADRKVISPEDAVHAHLRDVAWAFGMISRGMYSADGLPKNYGQLASIQLGWLARQGVLVWKPELKAANGTDVGCFEVNLAAWRASVDQLAKVVLQAKGKGDRAAAEKLKAEYVDAKDEWARIRGVITERWLRAPKATFVYSVAR